VVCATFLFIKNVMELMKFLKTIGYAIIAAVLLLEEVCMLDVFCVLNVVEL